ncbi:hypothetical protein MMC07_001534 [Pseudocyphellaria aurata]|nr:hypothetical protein [Pseudocyphellaria aurata]
MRFLWVLMKPSAHRICTFLLCTIVHSPFDASKSALAQPPPPGPIEGPDGEPLIPDYPSDTEIFRSYIEFGQDTTAIEVDPSDDGNSIEDFCYWWGTKSLPDSFPEDYLLKHGRSDRWYPDFLYRASVIFLQRAQGVVYMLSRAEGPGDQFDDCDFWYNVQFVTLKANPFVRSIVVVNDQDYDEQWIYWMPGDERPRKREEGEIGEGEREFGDVGNRPSGNYQDRQPYKDDGDYWRGNVMNAVSGTLGAGVNSVQTGVSGLLRAVVGGQNPPTAPPGGATKERKDQPDTGTKTDVLNLNIGALPDSLVGIDGQSTVATVNPTLATDFFPANDETSIGGLNGLSNTETSLNLFGRGRRIMQPRAATASCLASWFDDLRNPGFPSRRRKSDVFKIHAAVDKFLGQLYKWLPGDLATVQITQHKKQSEVYHIDISVLDPKNKVIFGEQQIVAQPGKEIAIDTQGRLNVPLYVKVEDDNEKPIYFRYGNPPFATQWYSNDPPVSTGPFELNHDHHCETDPMGPWDEKRQIRCRFTP